MYSRSFGIIENGKESAFSVPPDYGGNAYRSEPKRPPEPPREEPPPQTPPPPREERKKPSAPEHSSGFLDKLTAEDILLFVFLYSLIRGEKEDSGEILGLVLALLLL